MSDLGRVIPSAVLALVVGSGLGAQAPVDTTHPRDQNAPMWTSIGATIIPAGLGAVLLTNGGHGGALMLGGIWFGPAVGYWTHGVASRSVPGLLIRTGGLVLTGVGVVASIVTTPVTGNIDSAPSSKNSWVPGALLIGGIALVLGSAAYDIATVDRKVRERQRASSSIDVMPLVAPNGRRAGIEVLYRF